MWATSLTDAPENRLTGAVTTEFGKGFDKSSLRRMRQFFKTFPNRATLWHEWSCHIIACCQSYNNLLFQMCLENLQRRASIMYLIIPE